MENTFTCLNCSNSIQINDDTNLITCSHCESEFDLLAIKEYKNLNKQDFKKLYWEKYEEKSGSGDWTSEEKSLISSFVCPHCGSEMMTNNNTQTDECPFCMSKLSILGTLDGTFRPDLIIPFAHDKETAKKQFASYFSKKKLLPKLFKSEENLKNIQGVYVPVWLYDCKLSGKLNYNATKDDTAKDGSTEKGISSHYAVIRDGELDFKKIPSCASKKVDEITMEALEPFNYDECEPFNINYLNDFIAEQYDVEPSEMQEVINHIIASSFSNELMKTFRGYSSNSLVYKSFSAPISKINYALIPVWILNTKYKGRKYSVTLNGQFEKFTGVLPIDKQKQTAYFLAITSLISIIISALTIFF